ncbi:hypothetical protein PV342_39930 [Streptomyces sp. PA03-3a]|nr:hypothetical protein [Streptomyces sp. PA03-3a]
MGLPSVASSLVIRHAALVPTMIGLAAVLSAGTVLAVVTSLRGAAATRRPHVPGPGRRLGVRGLTPPREVASLRG